MKQTPTDDRYEAVLACGDAARDRRATARSGRCVALALIFAVDGMISPDFFSIRIVEGRLFGNLIDILYRAVPTALVALGMAVVIGTKGIDLSVGSIIAIVGAVITWRIHAGDPHLAHPPDRARRRACCAACGTASWSRCSTSSRSSRR